jgi:hypothetical protein
VIRRKYKISENDTFITPMLERTNIITKNEMRRIEMIFVFATLTFKQCWILQALE